MKQLHLILLALVFTAALPSCRKVIGKGPTVTVDKQVGDFNTVEFGLPGDLHYTPGSTFKVEISAQQNIQDIIVAEKIGSTLKIRFKDGRGNIWGDNINVKVTAPDLLGLGVNGSGKVHAQSMRPSTLKLWANGSGEVTVNELNAESLEADISGSGKLKVWGGAVKQSSLTISGSGRMEMDALRANDAVTRTSGSGDIWVFAVTSLDSKISGSGNVRYKGSPKVNSNISGSGKVQPM